MLRVAILSVHTCPLAAPGGKETGGMNVYVRETARELARMAVQVDVFTRSQDPSIPRVVAMGHGARVIHLTAGARAPMRREAIHGHLGEFVTGVERFRRAQGIEYDIIHAHYWLSGAAGLALRDKWGAPRARGGARAAGTGRGRQAAGGAGGAGARAGAGAGGGGRAGARRRGWGRRGGRAGGGGGSGRASRRRGGRGWAWRPGGGGRGG